VTGTGTGTPDVVVVGAGIAGASAAYELARRCSVVLVEAESQPGHHATGRSAALLNSSVGDRAICDLATASRPFLEAPPSGFCEHPLLSPRGLMWVAGRDDADALAALALETAGVTTRLDAAGARAIVPTLTDGAVAAGALHEPTAMTIDVASLLAGYLRGVRARGAVLSTNWEALTIERRADRWSVTNDHGDTVEAPFVVNAAGAWGDVVAARAGVAPIGLRTLRRTAALAVAPDWVARWPMIMDVGGGWYAEPEAGGLLISPADETPTEPCDVLPDEIDVAMAIERVNAALGLSIRSIRRAWAGLRTFCHDRRPTVGVDPAAPGFVWLVGQGGGGVKTAPAMAALTASIVLDGVRPPDELAPDRLVHVVSDTT
jgi:D-arginine dehydrogenase